MSNSTEIKEFDAQQQEKLEKVFQTFFDKSTRISTIAKTTKLAILGNNYDKKHLLEDVEIEVLLETILDLSDFIHNECFDLAGNANLALESTQ